MNFYNYIGELFNKSAIKTAIIITQNQLSLSGFKSL